MEAIRWKDRVLGSTRGRVIALLRRGPRTVNELADDLGLTDNAVRTHLSALPIEDRLREQMIAHAQPGLHRVYDQHAYAAEKLRGFELWEARLAGILYPRPPELTDIIGL